MLRALSLALLVRSPIATSFIDDTVDVGYAKYKGIPSGDNVKAWLGIRFAAPPVGQLRFAAPADPVQSSPDVQVADKFGPRCLETGRQYANRGDSSEDCLFLNVFSPANASAADPLPVYIFIQGGGFNSNSNPNINATGLIAASGFNMVVVNFNYRVGPYGFLASREISTGGSTNNGLKDQRKVFQWVQKHISKFGGDPKHVVIGGASAGGASVTLHMTAYGGRDDGLFHGVAAESQSFGTMLTVDESQYVYDGLVSRTGCKTGSDTLSCLRSLPIDKLQDSNTVIPFPNATGNPLYLYGPTLDYDIVSNYTYAAYINGAFLKIPAIYGDDTNEGTIFVPKGIATQADADTFLKNQFPALTEDDLAFVHAAYFPANGTATTTFPGAGAYWRPLSDAYGEIRYVCPGVKISGLQIGRIWNYRWDVQDPDEEANGRGVTHTVELAAIWGHRDAKGAPVPNGGPKSYATTNGAIIPIAQGYWASFVRSLNPNTYRAAGSPVWGQWRAGARPGDGIQRIRFRTGGAEMEYIDYEQQARCEYLGNIAVRLRQR